MIDEEAVQLAIRNRLLSLAVCTTGAITMSVTVSGGVSKFVRVAGSFITDGFAVGMEALPSGMSGSGNNAAVVVRSRSALELVSDRTLTAEGSASGKTLTVGLPLVRVMENLEATDSGTPLTDGPVAGRPYFREAFEVTRHTLRTQASGGKVLEQGIYHAHFYLPENTGSMGPRRLTRAVRALFTPGTVLTAGSHSVRMEGNPGVSVSPLQPLGDGRAHTVVDIPWRVLSRNTIAA